MQKAFEQVQREKDILDRRKAAAAAEAIEREAAIARAEEARRKAEEEREAIAAEVARREAEVSTSAYYMISQLYSLECSDVCSAVKCSQATLHT